MNHISESSIRTLHRYFICAAFMMDKFREELVGGRYLPTDDESPLILAGKFISHPVGIYMSHWYGALYVVCEAWEELGLSDQAVDSLLGDPKKLLLKRYRNGVFHYQKKYFDDRITAFQKEQGSAKWACELTEALSEWFLSWFDSNRKQQQQP